jgi:hypothetical protein
MDERTLVALWIGGSVLTLLTVALWVILPLAVFGIKPLLRKIRDEPRRLR